MGHKSSVIGSPMAAIRKRQNRPKPYSVRWRETGQHRSRSFKRHSEAKAFLAVAERIEAEQKAGTYKPEAPAGDRTVAEQYEVWSQSRAHLSDSTRGMDRAAFNRWILPAIGNKRLRHVSHEDLDAILAQVTEAGRSPRTRSMVYNRMNMLLDHALGPDGHTGRRASGGSGKRQRRPSPLTAEQLDRLLGVLDEPWDLFCDTMATLGLRWGECADLDASCFDWNAGTVTIEASKQTTVPIRTLPIPDRLADPLQSRAAANPDGLWGRRPNSNNFRNRVWNPALDEAGLDDSFVPYDLRHTCASLLIARGATPTDVAQWLGNSPRVVLEHYAHLFPGRKQELANLLDEARSVA